MKFNILVKSIKETQKTAKILAQNLKGGEIIAFVGNLGSGKTTFIQGIASGLGIKEKVSSPTFVIFKKYSISKNKGLKWLNHFDLYRLNNIEEILDLGFEEIIKKKNSVTVIEWAEKIEKFLPQNYLKISIEYINKNFRKIIFSKGNKN